MSAKCQKPSFQMNRRQFNNTVERGAVGRLIRSLRRGEPEWRYIKTEEHYFFNASTRALANAAKLQVGKRVRWSS